MRLPASYCGVVGLKPSYGLISRSASPLYTCTSAEIHPVNFRWGVISFADSLDCVGVLGKSVDTVKQVFGGDQFVNLDQLLTVV